MKTKKKKQKKHIDLGIAHIKSTFNNTIITITDEIGNVISWQSTGMAGFKGTKRDSICSANG